MRLPRDLAGRDAVRAFERAGWVWVRTRGSHALLQHEQHDCTLSIPLHDSLAPGLLRGLLRDAEMTVEEFLELL